MNALASLSYFKPELFLTLLGFSLIVLDLLVSRKKILGWICLLGLCFTFFLVKAPGESQPLFFNMIVLDGFAVFFKFAALITLAFTVVLSLASSELKGEGEGELYAFLTFLGIGLMLMASASNFLMLFLSIEFVSLTSYILAGYKKDSRSSNEAAIKYLLFGSVASAVMLYGISFLFGITGSLDFTQIGNVLSQTLVSNHLLGITLCLILAGIGFKISMAPFHMWAPDVYTGAPTPVTAFLTVGPKALGFAVMIRVLFTVFPAMSEVWQSLLMISAALTMTIGNVIALKQDNVKRLLAYSSIAQAGYILMGIVAANSIGLSGVLFYIIAYAFTNMGAFAIILIACPNSGDEKVSDFKGLSQRAPLLAIAMTVIGVSLIGLPPIAGYFGKLLVFAGTVEKGFYWLAIVAALNSALAAFYYFRIIKEMYLSEAPKDQPFIHNRLANVAVLISVIAILALGILPGPLLEFIQSVNLNAL